MKLTLQKKIIMPIKTSKNKPITELQKEKNMPGSSFCREMRSQVPANGLSVNRSNPLLQIAIIAAE